MIKTYLTFDDVLLLPNYSEVLPKETVVKSKLTKGISLNVPLVSSPMDTVTEHAMAIAMAKAGGIGIIHKNMTVEKQVEEVKLVKNYQGAKEEISSVDSQGRLLVGVAITVNDFVIDSVKSVKEAGADVVILDTAHGHSYNVIKALKAVKAEFPDLEVIVGNIVTKEAVKALAEAGADGLRVGIGSGSCCTTRIISGVGAPQLSAVMETAEEAKKYGIPIISDGGTKYSGDIVKALAAGAGTVMLGSLLAGHDQTPGDVIELDGIKFKVYSGMCSTAAMIRGEDERYDEEQNNVKRKLVPEGIEAFKEYKGDVELTLFLLVGGLKAGLGYNGAHNVTELQENANFVQITAAGKTESHPHSVKNIKAAVNYSK